MIKLTGRLVNRLECEIEKDQKGREKVKYANYRFWLSIIEIEGQETKINYRSEGIKDHFPSELNLDNIRKVINTIEINGLLDNDSFKTFNSLPHIKQGEKVFISFYLDLNKLSIKESKSDGKVGPYYLNRDAIYPQFVIWGDDETLTSPVLVEGMNLECPEISGLTCYNYLLNGIPPLVVNKQEEVLVTK